MNKIIDRWFDWLIKHVKRENIPQEARLGIIANIELVRRQLKKEHDVIHS